MSTVKRTRPGLYTTAVAYAKCVIANHQNISLLPLHQAALRFAARRLRRTGEAGSDLWAGVLERMADDEGNYPGLVGLEGVHNALAYARSNDNDDGEE